MPHINARERAIGFKIVYFGPGMSGKTTNLVRIHRSLAKTFRGELVSIDTTDERTLFFDYFPVELGSIGGYAVRINLYTVPGQIHYEASRKLIVDGADGIVFVVDSQQDRHEDNLESFRLMRENLIDGRFPPDFPVVLQYNKRDCDNPIALGTLEREFALEGIDVNEAIAKDGVGVLETIRSISRRVINRFEI
jgi:signal recognition particle receptor subunit beta